MPLSANRWGKSAVRVSKILASEQGSDLLDLTVQVLLEGDVHRAHTEGDNTSVLPTDTMKNTVYALAQEHLDRDIERFGEALAGHFLRRDDVYSVQITIHERLWERSSEHGFLGGGSEQRTARVVRGETSSTYAGVEGLVVLKTTGSSFEGFPRDQYTVLPDARDRLLATSVTAEWAYASLPEDTTGTWHRIRSVLLERFFADWSASVQHQGYMMGEAVLDAVPEISEIDFRLPNQHHLPFDLSRFGMEWEGSVFQPVSEPYGDIFLTVTRD